MADEFDVTQLDPDARQRFERRMRELKAFQQEIREITARLARRLGRTFGNPGDGTLFTEK